ncbi:hypothetical protein Syun_002861 [Stephania yunnanensis]|uniref:Uncharacterized protein n=1 Tax=Stephania yunnanensis TaxID=152371 RepID=A0AAP0L244_9MAGN
MFGWHPSAAMLLRSLESCIGLCCAFFFFLVHMGLQQLCNKRMEPYNCPFGQGTNWLSNCYVRLGKVRFFPV